MAALKFASSHNMVAFLDKPTKSDGFEQIVDFLNAHPIKYALTVNPTIYTSCIEQFWTTAKVKTINGEVQIQALVDKKKVIITETSIRSDLQLEDAEGTECLPNATIFKQLTLMGYENLTQKLTFYKAFFSPQWKFLIHTILQCLSAKTTAWNEFSSTMASAIICLATNQKFNFSKYIFDNMVKNLEGEKKQPMRKQRKDTKVPQPSGSTDPITDEAANEEHRVLDMDNTKTSQAAEIAKLKEKVKKLERRNKSRTPGLKRLRKVGRTTRIESSKDEGLGAQEDASKQGRKIADLDADAETLIEIKEAKPKAVTSTATTTTTVVIRPKARGVVVQEPNSFVLMDPEVVEGSKSHAEGSKKRKREELESDNSKKQKIDENVEAEVDD
ncbi:hypothetical protein Tco_1315959 [Tanacetum coccineum]